MKQLLLLFISFFVCLSLFAQTDTTGVATDTALVASDSVFFREEVKEEAPEEKPQIIQASVNVDYGKLLTTVVGWDEKYEAGASLLFLNQYFILGEYGKSVLSPENAFKNGEYTSDGSYYRIGGGYLKQLNPKSKLGLGVLYARSQFEDEGTVLISSPTETQDDYTTTFKNENLEARWMEVVITSENRMVINKKDPEARINQLFALGFYLRARFLAYSDTPEPFDVYTIPGYGRTVNSPNLALNLFLKVYLF